MYITFNRDTGCFKIAWWWSNVHDVECILSAKTYLQVHYIEFDDENNVINKTVFSHKEGEIWYMSASPLDKDVFATIYNKGKSKII